MTPLVLASASPRRHALLRQLGLSFEVVPSDVEESVAMAAREPADLVKRLALAKARDVAARFDRALVIGADTVVVLGADILGKPLDPDEAKAMLRRLAGQCHQVYTGVAVVEQPGGRSAVAHDVTSVWMQPMSEGLIEHYVNSGEPLDKAGAYAVQGRGAVLVQRIFGCYYNVVGLPLHRLAAMLEEFGLTVWGQEAARAAEGAANHATSTHPA